MKSVMVTNGEIASARAALGGIAATKIKHGLNMKFVMAIKRASDFLEQETKTINEVMQEMSKEYLQKDGDGNPVPSEDGSGYIIEQKNRVAYFKKSDELMGGEVEFPRPIPVDLLEEFLASIGEGEEVLSIAHILSVLPITTGGKD